MGKASTKQGANGWVGVAAAVLAAALIGTGVAAAAVAKSPADVVGDALHTLTIGGGVQVAPAYGADDEDCVMVSRHIRLPGGNVRMSRKLVCPDAD